MVKANVHNVICAISGVIGASFGAYRQKLYCMMGEK